MTPAIKLARLSGIDFQLHEYAHDPSCEAYGNEAATKLGLAETQVFKTLLVRLDNKELAVGIVPVCMMLNMKSFARAAGAKKACMADAVEVERSSGYVLGGVSPLAQKKRLKTFIDVSAESLETIYVSAGRRGLEIQLNPYDLQQLSQAQFAHIAQ